MRVAGLIRKQTARLSVVETLDVGKPLQEAEGDIGCAARCFEYMPAKGFDALKNYCKVKAITARIGG